MLNNEKDSKEMDEEYIGYEERNKFLWSLRSDFAWEGKKIPENVEIEGQEYRLRDIVRRLEKKEVLDTDEAADIRDLIPKLREQAKVDEELLETEELTRAEAKMLFEEAAGLLRAAIELIDKLEGWGSKKGPEEFKKMLNTQKLLDERSWQALMKSLKE
jgi:hypothetical protein